MEVNKMSKLSVFLVIVIGLIIGFTFVIMGWSLLAWYAGIILGSIAGIQGEKNRKEK
jgi:uncharacterized membrane protein